MRKYPTVKFKQTVLHLVVSGCYLNTAMAQIIADYSAPAAQRPAILKGNNNQPIVNIQTPNNKGVSHNRYTQFDIDSKGVMLNNHRTNNPHLAKGTAKVILNEVRSNKASQINGKVQVAGNRADVIIANPTGISINGASTQNINHMVFTTGTPQFKNNAIDNINIEKGKITVGKQGLNSNSNYTQLLGRAVEIQGKISADKLLVSAGGQLANYQYLKLQGKNGEASSKPQIGIDTSALGGMYANHIHLVTNEYGVGVRNTGTFNANATLLIDSSGKIENKGTIQANEKQVIRTKHNGANGDILLQPNSKISGSADTLVSSGGQLLVNQAIFSQTKSQSALQPELSLSGNSITFNAGKVDTPNPVLITTTSGALKLDSVIVNSNGKLLSVLNEKQNKQKSIENEINNIKQNGEYAKLKNEMNALMSHFNRLGGNNLSLVEIANQKRKMLQPFDDKIKELEHKKSELNTLTSILNRNGDIQTPQFTEINAGDITFNLAGGLDIQGANLHSNKNITINSYGSSNNKTISIQGQHLLAESGSGDDYSYVSIYQPSILNAKNNITLNALQPTGNNSVAIKGSKLNAENGVVNIAGYGDVALDYAKDEYYRYHKYSYKHGSKVRRKTTTVINEQQHSYAVPTVISAKNGISITAGEHLKLFASELNAPQNKISLTAGKGLSLYAVDEQHKTRNESHTKKRFLGIKTGSSHHEREQILNEQLPVKLVAQSAQLKSGWDTLLQGTTFQTLTGAKIEAGVGEKARGDAKILLQGIKTTVQNEESKRKTGIVWQSFQNKGLIEESLALPTFTGGKPIFNASGGIVVDIPKGKLRNELEELLKKPEYAYLKNLKLNDNVQWKEVSLAYQQWDYKQQGLTGAGAAIIALAMAVVTAGAGAAALGVVGSAYAPIANAAFTALTTQATTSLVNNRGNLNQTFKDLGSKQQVRQFATTVISAGVADKLVGTVNINTGSGLLDTLGNNLINASSTAVVQVGINGGKFTKALENAIYNALIDTAHAELAKNIKGIKTQADANKWYREAAHKIAHAVAGCGAAAGKGGKCTDGALGAALGEVVGELFTKNKTRNEIDEIEVINKTKLIVGSVAAALGKDVNMSVAAAHIAVKFNTVNKKQAGTIVEFLDEMNNSRNKIGLKKGLDAEDALIKLSGFDLKKLQPNGVAYFNNKNARYIYTEKAGWIDMVHFLFYAGISYLHKKDLAANNLSSKRVIENTAINRAVAHGYVQEISDMVISKHSAFEYEDLVSDKQGAIFGAKHFDPKSNLNLGQQVKLYFEKELKATKPNTAPNYHQLPPKDIGKHSGVKNYTTSPLFTK